ncbi:MAG TPA: hypothetical protein VGL99_15895 [Chloroflexota bacterium]|jgi:hypothetical protein
MTPKQLFTPWWAWLLILIGLALTGALTIHGSTAYAAIVAMDSVSKLDTPNPLFLFSDVTSTGIKVNNQVDPRNRGAYADALTQLVLDGTGVCIGVVLLGAGVFVRLNE